MAKSSDPLYQEYVNNERSIRYALEEIDEIERKIEHQNSAGEDALNLQLFEKNQLHDFLLRKREELKKRLEEQE